MNTDNKITYQSVEFDPFSAQEWIPTTEPQREILANIFLGGHPANCSYNESVSLLLNGPFDPSLLLKSIPYVISRHQALRSQFAEDGLSVRFTDKTASACSVVDLSTVGDEERNKKLQDILDAEAETAFDIHNGPLYRFLVVKLLDLSHQLILSFHHIVCDGWSLGIIMQDLGTAYSALHNGNTPHFEPAVDFNTYVEEEAGYELSDEGRATGQFWIDKFKNRLPSFEFPPDKPRPAVRTFAARRVDVEVDPELVDKMRKMATRLGISYVTMLTSAFEIYLHRVTSHSDIVLAMPAAGQSATGHHFLVGHCVNVLPLRTEINPDVSFSEYAKTRKKSLLDSYDHQRFTFGSLIKKLNMPRDPSRIPLVPVAFNLDIGITDGVAFEGCSFEFTTNPRHYENFEIFVNASGQGNKLVLECTHNTDLFDSALMKTRMEEFTILLESMVQHPDLPVKELQILTAWERNCIFETWNRIDQIFNSDLSLSGWFEMTAEKFPDHTAVITEKGSVTYRQLNSRANKLAEWISNSGIAPGSFIAILTRRNIDLMVSILGVLKARCVYVPVDPGYPAERIQHILSDSGSPVMIVSSDLRQLAVDYKGILLEIDKQWEEEIGPLPGNNPSTHAAPNDLAYIIYTSGSTGKPKGSLIEHRNVTRLFTATDHWYGFNEKDVWTMFHSAAFDFSVWEMWGALLYGGRLVMVSYEVSRDPALFYELLKKEHVTVLNQTPSAFKTLIQVDQSVSNPEHRVSSLRYIIFGGEALELESLRPWIDNHGDEHPALINMYGITETTVHVTYRQIRLNDIMEGKGSMVGVPIPDLQVYLLDEYRQPVPVGIPGEMYVGGAGVGRGYLNRPDLTGQRFLFNEFNPFAGTPLYRSGDLARLTPNGDIEYLGRIDNQVKIRGFRIELGEIESVLGKHPAVRQQVVIAREDEPGDKRLVAYLVMKEGQPLEVSALREYMKLQLPEYMIPAAFVPLDHIPVTSNGKTDRKALPRPDMAATAANKFVEPYSPLEEMLAHIWCDVLGLIRVGTNDNFFELGGHSILGVKMFNQVEKELGVKMNLPVLFTAPTISELARIINKEGPSKPFSSIVPLQSAGKKTPLFCIHMHNGNVNRWRVLVKHLGKDQPVYAIQPRGLDPSQIPHTTIEQMAEYYIGVMRELQPVGPYNLIGLCFSGMVVFEMASRLEQMGEKVDFLGMVNNYAPPPNPTLYRIKTGWNKFMKLEMGEKFQYILDKNFIPGRKNNEKPNAGKLSPETSVEEIQIDPVKEPAGNDLRTIHSLALLNYHPVRTYNGNLFIFRTSDPIEMYYNQHLGWDRLIFGTIETTIIDGCDNDTIITDEPYNAILSLKVKEYLDRIYLSSAKAKQSAP